jgi:hypothetical protein
VTADVTVAVTDGDCPEIGEDDRGGTTSQDFSSRGSWMGWFFRLVETGIDGPSRGSDVVEVKRPDGLAILPIWVRRWPKRSSFWRARSTGGCRRASREARAATVAGPPAGECHVID